jgi:hypothetical protein
VGAVDRNPVGEDGGDEALAGAAAVEVGAPDRIVADVRPVEEGIGPGREREGRDDEGRERCAAHDGRAGTPGTRRLFGNWRFRSPARWMHANILSRGPEQLRELTYWAAARVEQDRTMSTETADTGSLGIEAC